MAVGAAASAGEAGKRVATDAGSLAAQVAKATGDAAAKAKDAVANFAGEHPIKIEEVIKTASRVPGVRIDRGNYLLGVLNVHTAEGMARSAVETSPAEAGVPEELINKLANDAIAKPHAMKT